MRDIRAAVRAIEDAFDSSRYPAGFLEQYDQLECLATGRGTETFLAIHRGSGMRYVAKCYDKSLYCAVHESDILKPLCHSGLPAFVDEFENDATICIVREYIEGNPLGRYALEHRMGDAEIIAVCARLCDILAYLHGREPPVIHRDIKPENVIVKASGEIALIDFDIARLYKGASAADTEHLGTREYAPPEQYGFSQTDARADLYSLGVVLGWMLTGKTDARKVAGALGKAPLAAVYKKCTAFSPENRYASAQKLKAALLRAGSGRRKAAFRWTMAIVCCLAFLGAGFVAGRYTDVLSLALQPERGVAFEEPMIERAVRLGLGKGADESITEEDLLSITGLYAFGDSIVAPDENALEAEADRAFKANEMRVGPIRSLEDLRRMPNLKQVFLCMQQIEDISPLDSLSGLEIVNIKNNPVSDISALGELKFLARVSLFDTRVTDLSPLAACPMLHELEAGKLPFRSLVPFAGLTGLKRLSLYDTTLNTLEGIDQLTQLNYFEVSGVIDGDLTPLLALEQLKDVMLGGDMRSAAEDALGGAAFSVSYREG